MSLQKNVFTFVSWKKKANEKEVNQNPGRRKKEKKNQGGTKRRKLPPVVLKALCS